jgi:phosphatidylglycerol:prolipoprotein diacylglycerol transferase
MLIHPQINPIALDLGFLQVHWYGLTYLAAFGMFYLLATRRAMKPPFAPGWQRIEIEDMLFAGVLGVVLGGRLGYVLFYKPTDYFSLSRWLVGGDHRHGLVCVEDPSTLL